MELRHLRYFVGVAEVGHVTRAAERLHISQSPLSRQIRELEYQLGVTLFHRDRRHMRLTEAGEAFLLDARAILAQAENARRRAALARGRPERLLGIGMAPDAVLPGRLRDVLAGVKDANTGLCVNFRLVHSYRDALAQAAVDVVVTGAAPSLDGDIDGALLERSEVLVAVSQDHPLAARATLALADLADVL
ncbi:MAG TPA: LysR family transcriptional regulator, partial [Methylomirabilota bacterium]|nr:LysR family transcriptional regulator [Methylomirabilota bacterium]